MIRVLSTVCFALMLCACQKTDRSADAAAQAEAAATAAAGGNWSPQPAPTYDAAQAAADAAAASADAAARASAAAMPIASFGDYACTEDCSGHEAGYAWAEDNEINDPYDCDGNSQSFIEGCETYAQEQEDAAEDMASDDAEY